MAHDDDREDHEQRQDGLVDRSGALHEVEHRCPPRYRGSALLHLQCKEESAERVQRPPRNRKRAAGTAQTGQGSTLKKCCQTYDTMGVSADMLRSLRIRNLAVIEAVEVEFDPGFNVLTGETGAGKSILVEAVGLLLGGARLGRPGAHRRPTQATIEAIFERAGRDRGAHPARDHQPRAAAARSSTARWPRPACFATSPPTSSSSTASTSTRLLLDPLDAPAASSTPTPVSRRAAAGVADRLGARCATLREQLASASMDARERAARLELDRVPARRDRRRRRRRPGEDEELGRPASVLANAERIQRPVRGSLRRAVRRRRARRWRSWAASGRGSRSWRRSTRRSRRTSTRATAIKSQLEDLAVLPAHLRRRRGRLAGEAAAGRGPAGAARTAEAEVRAGARGRHRPRGRRCAPRAALLTGGDGAKPKSCERRSPTRATAYLTAARELSARAARGRRAVCARARRRCSPSWRWPRRASTSGSNRPRATPERVGRARDRPGRVLRLAESGRGPAPAGAHRLGRRAVAHHAGAADAGTRRPARGAHGRRARRKTLIFDEVDAGIGGRVADAVGALLRELGGALSGAVHHAPAADRRAGHDAVRDREAGRAADGR